MDFKFFTNKTEENSENYKLIKKFCFLWLILIFICFIIYLFTRSIFSLILWVGIYAFYRRQLLFDDKLKKNWELIKSNVYVKIINIVGYILMFFLFGIYIYSKYFSNIKLPII